MVPRQYRALTLCFLLSLRRVAAEAGLLHPSTGQMAQVPRVVLVAVVVQKGAMPATAHLVRETTVELVAEVRAAMRPQAVVVVLVRQARLAHPV